MKTALHGPLPSLFRVVLTLGLLAATPTVRAQEITTLTALHSFQQDANGIYPSTLVLGDDGNFYGTTAGGEDAEISVQYGTIFRITPTGKLTTLYVFTGGTDGVHPGGLRRGHDGNFYGTTAGEGMPYIPGTLFQVTPAGALTILHTFHGGTDDTDLASPVIQGKDGNFYGTTEDGGNNGRGTIFRITPDGVLTTLHTFMDSAGGEFPGPLVEGSDGNFYGTTFSGSENGYEQGAIFRITPGGEYTDFYVFTGGSDGNGPEYRLVPGSDGNLYGTTLNGGAHNEGTIFQLTTAGVSKTVHDFGGPGDDARQAVLSLQDQDGDFYGTTFHGPGGASTLFRFNPGGGLTTLAGFNPYGGYSTPALVQSVDGSLYGTVSGNDAGGPFGTFVKLNVGPAPSTFFKGEVPLGSEVYYLSFANGNFFGFYAFLDDPHYLFHFDLGYEYVFDAHDGEGGVYLYDFASNDFFYTSPTFPFPYLYDFALHSVLYYFPDPSRAGHYNMKGVRYFYDFTANVVISK